MSEQSDRDKLKARYPNSKSWASRVDKMRYDQVVAILLRLKSK